MKLLHKIVTPFIIYINEKNPSLTVGLLLNIMRGKWNQTLTQGIKSAAAVYGINAVQFCDESVCL